MCLILIANKVHPRYKLVVAANRDEFYRRPSMPAGFWPEQPDILAGRDMTGGGTWMGMNKNGRIGMITNYRDLANIKPDAPSRGHLVLDFLKTTESADKYLQKVEEQGYLFNGFNLICGTVNDLYYYGNYGNDLRSVTAGYHGLSNALLDTPWPKVSKGVDKMKLILQLDYPDPVILLEALYDDIRAPQELLPDTGVGPELEHMLSSMFIKSPDYGSRCSTVVLVDHQNNVEYLERTYDTSAFDFADRKFNFKVD